MKILRAPRDRTYFGGLCIALWALLPLSSTPILSGMELGGTTLADRIGTQSLRLLLEINTEFLKRVGGVAFSQLATNATGAHIVGLSYNHQNPDGSRLAVELETPDGEKKNLVAPIYDWQLVPLAFYANSKWEACFTLFGETKKEHPDPGERVLNYHPMFEDTLLGLRLFQADIVLMSKIACNLPKWDEEDIRRRPKRMRGLPLPKVGSYILGAGESPPDIEANEARYATIKSWIKAQEQPYSSYLICDQDQGVRFFDNDGKLEFTGRPVWLCWYFQPEYRQARAELRASLSNLPFQRVFGMDRDEYVAMSIPERKAITDKEKVAQFKEIREQVADLLQSNWMERQLMEEFPLESQLSTQPELSEELSHLLNTNSGINPVIYDSLLKTMHYGAFFRHVKAENSQVYRRFMKVIARVTAKPQLSTPTTVVVPPDPEDLPGAEIAELTNDES